MKNVMGYHPGSQEVVDCPRVGWSSTESCFFGEISDHCTGWRMKEHVFQGCPFELLISEAVLPATVSQNMLDQDIESHMSFIRYDQIPIGFLWNPPLKEVKSWEIPKSCVVHATGTGHTGAWHRLSEPGLLGREHLSIQAGSWVCALYHRVWYWLVLNNMIHICMYVIMSIWLDMCICVYMIVYVYV